jgi:hypothetical protein
MWSDHPSGTVYEGAYPTRAAAEADMPRLRRLYPDREPYISDEPGQRSAHVYSNINGDDESVLVSLTEEEG